MKNAPAPARKETVMRSTNTDEEKKTKKNEDEDGIVSEDLLRELLADDGFRYDVNGDELYRKYRDRYEREGRLAMKDTMGKAAALTGGYGNTYAETAAAAVRDEYAARAADKIPELYSLALERYRMGRDELRDKYETLLAREKDAAAAEAEREALARQIAKEQAAAERQAKLDALNEEKLREELSLKRDAQKLNEKKEENSAAQAAAKLAADTEYRRNSLSAKEKNDYLDYLLGLEKLASSKSGTLSDLKYSALRIKGVKDLDSLISYVQREGKKKGGLEAGNAYVRDWLDRRLATGELTEEQAGELWDFMRFYDSDFPKAGATASVPMTK